jgi:predicted NBD/HSP70 family sugar kinase
VRQPGKRMRTAGSDADRFPLTSPAGIGVFMTLLAYGPSTRAEIAQRAGISAAAVTKAVRPLLAAGMLAEDGRQSHAAGAGRPIQPLRVQAHWGYFAGAMLTADEIVVAVVDLTGVTRATDRVPLRSHDPDDAAKQLGAVFRSACSKAAITVAEVRCLGVALSGDVDSHAGVVRFSPFLHWESVALVPRIEAATNCVTVIENDVRALTVVEAFFGAGVGVSSLAVVTVGTGIGCGLYIDGNILVGANGVSGELGHLPVGDPSVSCYCGGHGCLEAVAADPAVLSQLSAALGRPVTSMAEAAALARDGDPVVNDVMTRAGQLIGRGIAALTNLVGPARIVLTGEEIGGHEAFEKHVREAFAVQAYGAAANCEIIVRPHPFEDWARGAAAVALRSYVSSTARKSGNSRRRSPQHVGPAVS